MRLSEQLLEATGELLIEKPVGGVYVEPPSPELRQKAERLRRGLHAIEVSTKATENFLNRYLKTRSSSRGRALRGEAQELWDLAFSVRRQILDVLKEK